MCPNSVHQLTNTDFSSIVDCYYHAAKKKQLRDAVEQANLRQYVNDEFVDKLKTEIRLKVLSQRNSKCKYSKFQNELTILELLLILKKFLFDWLTIFFSSNIKCECL